MKKISLYVLLNLPAFVLFMTALHVMYFLTLSADFTAWKGVAIFGMLFLTASVFSFPSTQIYQKLTADYYDLTGKSW